MLIQLTGEFRYFGRVVCGGESMDERVVGPFLPVDIGIDITVPI